MRRSTGPGRQAKDRMLMTTHSLIAFKSIAKGLSSRGENGGRALPRNPAKHPASTDRSPGTAAQNLPSPEALRALIETAAARGPDGAGAFAHLVGLYRPRVVSLVAGLLGDADQAEDVAQDAFMKIHAGLPGFRFESRFSSWVFRIACRTAIDHTRRRWWRRRVSLERLSEPGREEALLAHSETPPASPDPEARLLAAERARILRRALAEIPLAFRAPVVLKDLVDLPYEEIGRILDCPLGTVESRIHRGRLALRKKLERILR